MVRAAEELRLMATMADVAQRAGVSLSTVSYALSGVRPVSEATKERIRAAMEELDFAPNAVAQGLAGRRTRILALVLPTDETPVDPYTGEIIVGAAEAARASDYHLLLWTEPASRASGINELLRQQLIDGAIVLAVQLDDPRIAVLESAKVPLVMLGRTRDAGGLAFVDVDADATARIAVEHLADRGRRRIGYVAAAAADPGVGYGISARLHEGLSTWASAHDCSLVSSFHGRTADDAADAAERLLADGVDGIIAFGDVMVAGAIAGCAAAGAAVPAEVSVVGLLCTGFVAGLVRPQATTVSPAPADLGATTVSVMLSQLAGGPAEQALLVPELVVRSSS